MAIIKDGRNEDAFSVSFGDRLKKIKGRKPLNYDLNFKDERFSCDRYDVLCFKKGNKKSKVIGINKKMEYRFNDEEKIDLEGN